MLKKTLLSLVILAALPTVEAADIKIAYDSDPVSLDPMEQLSEGTLQMAHLLFDPLVRFDAKLELEPRLAEKWEQVDDLTTRFFLRKGVKFHSGREMNADDVLFTFNRLKNSGDYKGLFEIYDDVKKIDDYTVDFHTKDPYPLVLPNMTYFFVMDSEFYSGNDENGKPKDLVEKNTGTFAALNVSGTGPFTLKSRQQGVKSVYQKNPNYWGETGNVDTLTLLPIKENATRVSALLSGDVDLAMPIPPTDLERVKSAKNKVVYGIPSDRMIFLELNQKVVPEFQKQEVREAVNLAIHNAAIVKKILRDDATPAGQFSPEGYLGHVPELKARYDLKKAQELMKKAGLEKGFTVNMISPNNRYINDEKVAQAVAGMLAKINIKVNLTTMPKAQYWPEFDKCEAGISLIGWSSDTGDSANYSEYLTMTKDEATGKGQYNCGGYSIPELDQLLNESNQTVDLEKRKAILQKVSKLEYEKALIVPLYWQNLDWGYSDRFENFPTIVNLKNFPHYGDLKVKE